MKINLIKISEIATLLDIKCIGKDYEINELNLLNRESSYDSIISYLTSEKNFSNLLKNKVIKGLFVTPEVYDNISLIEGYNVGKSFLIVDFPEVMFYKLHEYLYKETIFYKKFDFVAIIGSNCSIHKSAVIDDGVVIGDNVRIGANSVVKKGTIINDNTIIGCCSVIGGEGFQLIYDQNNIPFTVTHIGGTYIGKNVLINDNCTVCNYLFEGYVLIEDYCKIDSQVHIGHNCKVGKNSVITGNSLLMGSVEIRENVWIAPSTTISNKCIIEDNSFVGAMSLVTNNISKNIRVCGNPAIPIKDYIRIIYQQKKLLKNGK
jgi:UDP-3-O-[3-hydroxymyristoyl] glucosamine N-acyltransferase